MRIEYINLDEGFVLTEKNEILPIVHLCDEDGDDCDVDEAVTFVFGTEAYGYVSMMVPDGGMDLL